jgi:hypothetical protein
MQVAFALVIAAALTSTPSKPSIARETPRWGTTLAEMRRLAPGGTVLSSRTGLETYRVIGPVFGVSSSIATFSFHPRRHLNVVVFEFPAGKPSLQADDYLRPSREAAKALYSKLDRALTARFGKPTSERSGLAGRFTTWRGREEFVRLQSVPVANEREDVRIWLDDRRGPVEITDQQNQLEWVTNRTDPSSWSATGALDVRWGMGFADVLGKHSDFRCLWNITDPIKTATTDAYLDRPVHAFFDFFEGQLTAITLTTLMTDAFNFSKMDDDQTSMFEADVERWRKNVHQILTEKYGPPIREPSELEMRDSTQAGTSAQLVWVWKYKDMGISYVRRSARDHLLNYENIGPLGQAAYEATKKADDMKEAQRKAQY